MSQIIRYANDLLLTELAREATNLIAAMNYDLRDGYLDAAFLKAHKLTGKLEGLKERLNRIRYDSDGA